MNTAFLASAKQGHLTEVLQDLVRCGWVIKSIPANGKVPRNGMKVVLKSGDAERRLRIFAYKVTSSSRSRPDERRVEITTTYRSGLERLSSFSDVVLGMDVISGKYVGIDSRRLELGGRTHNASSFFDLEGLSVKPGDLLINPRSVANSLFPGRIELHSFCDHSRLSEYLFNQREIHSGLYAFGGAFSGPIPRRDSLLNAMKKAHKASGDTFVLFSREKVRRYAFHHELVTAVEGKDFSKVSKRKVSPEQLKKLMSIWDEIGALGEQAVVAAERRRLRRLGFLKQANRVERVSLRSVGEGYDILSFEDDGVTKRYLEVKATTGKGHAVDVSRGEWDTARRHRSHYYLVRVTCAKDSPQLYFVRDPVSLEQQGLVSRTANGWKVNLRLAMSPRG